MHYYVQVEFKNAYHFKYKERYKEEEEYISTFIIKLYSNPICEMSLHFGQTAIIINHPEQLKHGRVWNVDCLIFFSLFILKVGLCYSFQILYRTIPTLKAQMQTGYMIK